jgi:competence protein ComEC
MSRLGIVHILSISGFHLVLVAAVVVFIIRLTGDRGVWEYALAAAAIGLYLLVIPAQAPVVRSGVMVLVLLLTEASGRRYDRLNILAWTACALALWRPLDLYSPGFQLSFGVTAALIWRASAWNELLAASGLLGMPGVKGRVRREPETAGQWVIGHLAGLCTATAIAWCVSSAVVAYHIGVLSLAGILAGIVLTVPSIIAIGAGFIAMLVAMVWPAAGEQIGAVALFFSDLTVRGSHLAAQLPGSSMPLPQVPLAWTIATTAASVVAIAPGGWRRSGVRVAVLGCVLWLTGIMLVAAWPIGTPTIDRFALPDSSATLLRAADQAVLIDPGSSAKRSGAFTLRRAVAASGAWRVRTVVITGPQTERFDHLPELVRTLGVNSVLLPPTFERVAVSRPGGDQERLLRRLRGLGIAVRTLEPFESLTIGDLSIVVEGPGVVRLAHKGGPPQTLKLTPLESAVHRSLAP